MKNFRDRLGRELLLMDGAMGTMLQSRGLRLGELPGSMNLRAPEVVRSIHAEYAAAGADVIQANTFGVSHVHIYTMNQPDIAGRIIGNLSEIFR